MSNPLRLVRPFLVKNEPTILTALGVTGLLLGTFLGIKETFVVSKKIEEYKQEHNLAKLTPKEYFKLAWKHYLPAAISIGMSLPCVIFGNRIANRRYTALAAAYTISETALQEYREKTREIAGEKKAQQIQEAINEETIKKTYSGKNQIILTNNGESLFFEPLSGRYFKSSWNDIQKAANELNSRAIGDIAGVITLNEWFSALGLEQTAMGNEEGWSLTAYSGTSALIDISISSHLTDDNVPCGAIYYKTNPKRLE